MISFFKNNTINLSKIKNKKNFLFSLADAIHLLSESSVDDAKIAIGGIYHKNYYKYLFCGFYFKNSVVFNAKNSIASEFLKNIKYNLCNYGVYFYKKNKNVFLKIYSGNCIVLNQVQQNFINLKLQNLQEYNAKKVVYSKLKNYYLPNCVNLNLSIFDKRLNLLYRNKFNNNSEIKVKIYKNFRYEVFINQKKIDKNIFFNNFKKIENCSDIEIEKLIKKNYCRVVNRNFLLYNKDIYCFDICYTINYLEKKINDSVKRRLV